MNFEDIRIVRPSEIFPKVDDLRRFPVKILKHFFKIITPYFFGPKHTDIWGVGRFVSKVTGKRILDAQCEDGNWLAIPLPVYTSHFINGADYKRINNDTIIPIIKKLAIKGTVAIDVGASCGQEIVALSRAVDEDGVVYCFEPSFSFEVLIRTVGLNALKNVICVNAGCGAENGYINGTSDQEYVIGDKSTYASQGIPVVRIDDFLDFIKETRNVSFMKIDTDGFEVEVIKGAEKMIERHNTKVVAEFESHFTYSGAKGKEALKRYQSMGFDIHKIQTTFMPLQEHDFETYIKDTKAHENMIAHDIVLIRK